MRNALVASQVVFAVVLLVGAGFLIKSVSKLLSVSPGFNTSNRVVVDVVLPATPGSILWLIIKANMRVTLGAILTGLLVAAIATRALTVLL